MMIDSKANINSRVAGYLLSFLIPLLIVMLTIKIKAELRLLKFGSGMIIYCLLAIIILGLPISFVSGLIPCAIIFITVLYYGDYLLSTMRT